MAEIVAAMAMTHSPGLTGWFTRASEDYQHQALPRSARCAGAWRWPALTCS